jgi:autotransporter-associated beta strand protein
VILDHGARIEGDATTPAGGLIARLLDFRNGAVSAELGQPDNFAGVLNKSTAGTVTLTGVNRYTGGTNVLAGKLVAGSGDAFGNGPLAVSDQSLAYAQPGLAKAMAFTTVTTAGTGVLDLTNNAAVIRAMTQDQVRSLIASAFNAGTWTGGGMTSSTAAADAGHLTALGYGGNANFGLSTWRGVTGLDADDVLVRYTYYGDADLNGAVTLDDFTLFLIGYQNGKTTWFDGDFDYNGVVTLDDFTLFLKGYQQQGAPLSELESMINDMPISDAERAAMLAAVQAVPEPASVGLLTVIAAYALSRRRRRHPLL